MLEQRESSGGERLPGKELRVPDQGKAGAAGWGNIRISACRRGYELRPGHERLLFEVNITAAESAHLKISSRLLALARIVSPGQEGTGQ